MILPFYRFDIFTIHTHDDIFPYQTHFKKNELGLITVKHKPPGLPLLKRVLILICFINVFKSLMAVSIHAFFYHRLFNPIRSAHTESLSDCCIVFNPPLVFLRENQAFPSNGLSYRLFRQNNLLSREK